VKSVEKSVNGLSEQSKKKERYPDLEKIKIIWVSNVDLR